MMHVTIAHMLWSELHSMAREEISPSSQRMFMQRWLEETKALAACPSCWWKVERFCTHWPVAYGADLWLWSVCLHDYVNKELGKPLFYPELTLAPLTAKGILQ